MLVITESADYFVWDGEAIMRKRRGNEETLGCVIQILLIIFLMPIVGVVLLCKPSVEAKIGGATLLVIGLLLWVWIACA